MIDVGKLLIRVGLLIALVGLVLVIARRFGLGNLPGDFQFRKGNVTFYFPLVTSIVISIILTLLLNFFFRR